MFDAIDFTEISLQELSAQAEARSSIDRLPHSTQKSVSRQQSLITHDASVMLPVAASIRCSFGFFSAEVPRTSHHQLSVSS
jgi:hypothetical protein